MTMPIAIDAMGGDHGPAAAVCAAVEAGRRFGLHLLVVGDGPQVEAELSKHAPLPDSDLLQVVHTPEWIGMDESPGEAIRRKRKASILVAAGVMEPGAAGAGGAGGNP